MLTLIIAIVLVTLTCHRVVVALVAHPLVVAKYLRALSVIVDIDIFAIENILRCAQVEIDGQGVELEQRDASNETITGADDVHQPFRFAVRCAADEQILTQIQQLMWSFTLATYALVVGYAQYCLGQVSLDDHLGKLAQLDLFGGLNQDTSAAQIESKFNSSVTHEQCNIVTIGCLCLRVVEKNAIGLECHKLEANVHLRVGLQWFHFDEGVTLEAQRPKQSNTNVGLGCWCLGGADHRTWQHSSIFGRINLR